MLAGILIGAAAAAGAAAMCAACYIKGRSDGQKRASQKGFADDSGEEQSVLMKKYETIMGYDPYGERV